MSLISVLSSTGPCYFPVSWETVTGQNVIAVSPCLQWSRAE